MNHKKKIVITGLLIIVICFTACGRKEKENLSHQDIE